MRICQLEIENFAALRKGRSYFRTTVFFSARTMSASPVTSTQFALLHAPPKTRGVFYCSERLHQYHHSAIAKMATPHILWTGTIILGV
jgi:hypothetical protein